MKLITLNIWGGIVYKPLVSFIEKRSSDTDIFCFQEVLFGARPEFTSDHKARVNIFHEIAQRLPGHTPLTYIANKATHFQNEKLDGFHAGQAMFVRKDIRVVASGGFRGYQDELPDESLGGKITGSIQWVELKTNKGVVVIANLHGLWQKDTQKKDTPERLLQSEIIKDFFRERSGKKILCGDFNLYPDTKSVTLLEAGMKNLIKEYDIQSTRSSLYTKEGKFADYILASHDVVVRDFRVLSDEVSDHLPLYLDFE